MLMKLTLINMVGNLALVPGARLENNESIGSYGIYFSMIDRYIHETL